MIVHIILNKFETLLYNFAEVKKVHAETKCLRDFEFRKFD